MQGALANSPTHSLRSVMALNPTLNQENLLLSFQTRKKKTKELSKNNRQTEAKKRQAYLFNQYLFTNKYQNV